MFELLFGFFCKFQKSPICVRRRETLGSPTQTAQSAASATGTTTSPVSPGSAAQRRSARLSTDCWTAILQVNLILNCRSRHVVIIPKASTLVWNSKLNPHLLCFFFSPGKGICHVAGDPHYYTFDGIMHTFMGTCTYTLVEVGDGFEPPKTFICTRVLTAAMCLFSCYSFFQYEKQENNVVHSSCYAGVQHLYGNPIQNSGQK